EHVGERRGEVGEVVRCAVRERRALVRGGVDADDPHSLSLALSRLVLVPVQDSRHDLDVVVLHERLAELGEQVRRRLDARPVVLVEDEEAGSAQGLGHLVVSAVPTLLTGRARTEEAKDAGSARIGRNTGATEDAGMRTFAAGRAGRMCGGDHLTRLATGPGGSVTNSREKPVNARPVSPLLHELPRADAE